MFKRMISYAGLATTIAGGIKVLYDTNIFKVDNVKIETDKLHPQTALTILHLTDIHNKNFGKNNLQLIKKIKQLNPDIIVITGDLIDRKTTDFSGMYYLVEQLKSICEKLYFVSGNHEWGHEHTKDLFKGLEAREIHILDNTNQTVAINENIINIAGVADYATCHEDIDAALNQVQDGKYTILLSHAPDIINEISNEPIDLILSGHTHGGQIRLPFIGALVAPDQGRFPALDKGLFVRGEKQYLYIDSGLGTTWMPIRFFNQSQLSLITIVGK